MSDLKHRLKVRICGLMERKLERNQIIKCCPVHYGSELTYDHLNYFFDRTYDGLAKFSYLDLIVEFIYWEFRATTPKTGD